MSDQERTQQLIVALGEINPEAFLNDATFHHSIVALATMLVPMVEGLAARCREEEAERQKRMEELMWGPDDGIPMNMQLLFHRVDDGVPFNIIKDYNKKKD